MIDASLKKILVCPACHSDLEFEEEKILCKNCGNIYPIVDGIPVMLVDEATQKK